jgi:hypothetical protein
MRKIEANRLDRARNQERTDDSTGLDWDHILVETKRHVHSDSLASDALRDLIKAGCDEKRILRDLVLFCGGEPEKLKTIKKALSYQKTRVRDIARTLREAVTGIHYAQEHLAEAGIQCNYTPDTKNLVDYAQLLEMLSDKVLPPRKRLSGRDQHLAYLAKTIEAVTGRQHYPELAALVAAVEFAYNRKLVRARGATDLRKLVDRTPLDLDSMYELQELKASKQRRKKK